MAIIQIKINKTGVMSEMLNRFMIMGTALRNPLIAFILFLITGVARADSSNRALGLIGGDGEFGSHLSDRTYVGLVYDWDWSPGWIADFPERPAIYPEFNLTRWRGCAGANCGRVTDVGLTPVFRLEKHTPADATWYLDLGIGAHLLSTTRIGPQVYSTAFQFSEFAGIGWLLGQDRRYEIGVRYMHESNADLKLPNDGMNFLLFRVAVRW